MLDRVGPAERMMSVLARLHNEPRRIWPVQDLRRDISGYEDTAAGDRNWQYDSQALRARGLIRTGITSRHTPRGTGVRYGLPIKPGNLHLSEDEHAALIDARLARGTTEIPNPLAAEDSRGGQLEVIAEALRRLEERGGWMTVSELAAQMGMRPARLLEKLKLAWCLDVDRRSVFLDALEVDDGDGELTPAQVRVCVMRRPDPDQPLRGTGLALLGAGAYTLAETAERLELIEDVLEGRLPGDAATLQSAKAKLLRWQRMLSDDPR